MIRRVIGPGNKPRINADRADQNVMSSDPRISAFIRGLFKIAYCGAKRWRYSPDTMNALTISALRKSPLNCCSLANQNP